MKDMVYWRWRSSSTGMSMGMKDWQVDLCIFCSDANAVAQENDNWEENEGIRSRMPTVEMSFIRKVAHTSQRCWLVNHCCSKLTGASWFCSLVRTGRFSRARPAISRPWSRSTTPQSVGLHSSPCRPCLLLCFPGGAGGAQILQDLLVSLRSWPKFGSCPEIGWRKKVRMSFKVIMHLSWNQLKTSK